MNIPQFNTFAITELSKGMSASVPFTVGREDMERFALLSGDHNLLHLDDVFARGKGFEGVVVYGALIVAKVSQLIGMRLPGRDSVWVSISLDFVKPLYVGRDAQVDGTVTDVSELTGMLELKLKVTSTTCGLIARGKAEVLLVQ